MTGPSSSSSAWTLFQLIQYFGPRVFFAILCGGLIGLERELKNKSAGIKTNMLICLGSTIYTSVSLLMSQNIVSGGYFGDPTRVAAQIVSGIGFLGGGAIIQSRGTIQGLTTAATIWVVAAIGVCIGIGHADIAVFTSLLVILVLVGTTIFEDRILGRSVYFTTDVIVDDPNGHLRVKINEALTDCELEVDDFIVTTRTKYTVLSLRYHGNKSDHKRFILNLWSFPGILEVKHH